MTEKSPAKPRPRRILIIDDSEVMLSRMKRAMLSAGYDVVTTTHVVGNARHITSCDLIIIDYHMPGLNGSTVVESMKTVAKSGKHPCSFYVYTSDKAVSANYAQLGFDGAFTAKGDEAELLRQLAAYFRLADVRALRGGEKR
ncbi:MAG TPA: response regulator [Polyangiaceae bacterium]|nr:response regulator [Polyangiaceae bacterium]